MCWYQIDGVGKGTEVSGRNVASETAHLRWKCFITVTIWRRNFCSKNSSVPSEAETFAHAVGNIAGYDLTGWEGTMLHFVT